MDMEGKGDGKGRVKEEERKVNIEERMGKRREKEIGKEV